MLVKVEEYNKNSLQINDKTHSYIVESRIPSLRQGPQGIQGIQGIKGDSFEYQWDSETLKVKHSNETTWSEVNLKGETGDSLMFDIQGTSLGIKTDKQPSYTYFNLKGDKGDKGDSFMFTFDGTSLGVKTDKDSTYTVVNLKGDRGYDFQYKVEGTVLSVKSSDTATWTSVDLLGPQGIQGIQGIKGDRGHDMSFEWRGTELGVKTSVSSFVYTNLKGQQGIQGVKGDTGATGADSTVQGPKGDQGLRGERGESFKIDESADLTDSKLVEIRAKATPEDYWVFFVSLDRRSSKPTNLTGHLLICFGNNEYLDAGNIKGVKGDKGYTGDQGIQGDKGDKGDTGDKGIQGAKGDTGATGGQGLKGDTGAQGIQGIQGIQGTQGLKGDKGLDANMSAIVAKTGDTMTGDLSISKSNPKLILKSSSTSAAQTGWVSLQNSTGTETGYMGFGSSGTTDLQVVNQIGKVLLQGSTVEIAAPLITKGAVTATVDSANAQVLNLETAGGWSYIQLKSGAQVAHIAKNDTAIDGGAAGSLHLRPNGGMQGSLILQPNSTMKHQTSTGFVAIGCLNAEYAHFQTDRPNFHFDKAVRVQGEIFAGPSYNLRVYHQGFKPSAADVDAIPAVPRGAWKGTGIESATVGQLTWTNYGNNHTVFDASLSLTPNGTACNNTNSQTPWSPTYPTLMGFNGATTYGVRVDSARVADSASNANTVSGLSVSSGVNSGANQIVRTNSSGYIDAGWINTVSGTASGTPIRIYCSEDAYLRYYSPAQLAPYILTQGADKNAHTHNYMADNGSYNTITLGNWIRTTGGSGWYNETYGGGIHMSDTTWIRTYNGKKFHVANGENDAINVSGGIVAGQNVTAYSDERIKTDIKVIPDALNKISKIRGVTYTRTDTDSKLRQTGVIAQELREVLPEAVIESDSTLDCIEDGKLLTVAYGNVIGLLIEGIKEEKEERERLADETLLLKDMLFDIYQQINAIRGGF